MVRAPGAAAPSRLDELPDPTWRFLLGRGLPQFAVEAVGPVLAFYAGWRVSGLVGGIVAAGAVSLALAAVLVRRGSDVNVVALGVVFVAIQAVVGLVSHSTTAYLAQPVVFSTLLGIAYVVSVVVGRPLIGVFASAWYPFPDWFKETEAFRHEFALQTLVWAAYCIVRAALRLVVLLHSGVGGFVVVSLLTGVPPYALLVAWGLWHARRSFSRLDEAAITD
jgi:Protein of unknown function (DUF3159)